MSPAREQAMHIADSVAAEAGIGTEPDDAGISRLLTAATHMASAPPPDRTPKTTRLQRRWAWNRITGPGHELDQRHCARNRESTQPIRSRT